MLARPQAAGRGARPPRAPRRGVGARLRISTVKSRWLASSQLLQLGPLSHAWWQRRRAAALPTRRSAADTTAGQRSGGTGSVGTLPKRSKAIQTPKRSKAILNDPKTSGGGPACPVVW